MKKLIITVIVLAILGGLAFATIPDRQAHKDAIMQVVNEKVTDFTGTSDLGNLGATIGSKVIEYVLDNHLVVEDHLVYNLGYLKKGDEKERISVGVFGHVFTFSKEDLDKVLEEYGL